MTPTTYRVFLPLFLLSYCAVGFLTHSRFFGREIFPCFSWSLYSDASRLEVQYTARLLEIDGRPLTPPVDIGAAPFVRRSPDYWYDLGVAGNFGAALDRGDQARAEALRRLFEANVLLEEAVRYEMVKRTYAPLERRASGAYLESTLGTFAKRDSAAGDR